MYFSNLREAYKVRDYINMLFVKRGTLQPVVSVHRTMSGFKVTEITRDSVEGYQHGPDRRKQNEH